MRKDWTNAIAYLKRNLTRLDGAADVVLAKEDSPVLKDLGNGLLVSYVVDEGKSFSFLQNRHLQEAGIVEVTLHAAAINNLYVLAERHLRIQAHESIFAVFMDGNFEASVLLLETVWDISFAKYVRDEFAAVVPTHDVLAFGDSSSPQAVAELRAVIERVASGAPDHQISTSLYRRTKRAWVPWDL